MKLGFRSSNLDLDSASGLTMEAEAAAADLASAYPDLTSEERMMLVSIR